MWLLGTPTALIAGAVEFFARNGINLFHRSLLMYTVFIHTYFSFLIQTGPGLPRYKLEYVVDPTTVFV